MKIPSVNISPRVQCGKTAGKTRVSVTQLNSKLHCGDFVRMMLALLDFTLSRRQALLQTVVFPTVSVTWRILFPVCHNEAASSEAVSVFWVGGRGEIGC